MKAAVIYFSLTGNAKLAAEKVAGLLGADIIALTPETPYPTGGASKYFWGGKSSVMKETPPLKSYSFDPGAYDLVILGTPLWAWSITPPLRTFLSRHDLSQKAVAAFICCSGGSTQKAFDCIKAETKHERLTAEAVLLDPLKAPAAAEEKLAAFCEKIRGKLGA